MTNKVLIVGVGGLGIKTIDFFIKQSQTVNANYMAIDCCEQQLQDSFATIRLLIGQSVFNGQSSNGDFELVQTTVNRSLAIIERYIARYDTVILLVSFCGGFGLGFADIANYCTQLGKLTFAMVIKPLTDNMVIYNHAKKTIDQLSKSASVVPLTMSNLAIDNIVSQDRLLDLYKYTSDTICGLNVMLNAEQKLNVDKKYLYSVLQSNSFTVAFRDLIDIELQNNQPFTISEFINKNMQFIDKIPQKATIVLLNIVSGVKVSLKELGEWIDNIRDIFIDNIGVDMAFMFGIDTSHDIKDRELLVTIIANGDIS